MHTLSTGGADKAGQSQVIQMLLDMARGLHDIRPRQIMRRIDVEDQPVGSIETIAPTSGIPAARNP